METIERILKNPQTIAETLLSEGVNFDTRKVTNRSTEKIPASVVQEIEERGVTIERLESLGLPVYKYATQVTIHGVFPKLQGSGRVGGFKNLIVNQNQTLGVRYNGIDALKKELIAEAIRFSRDTGFRVQQDSRGFTIQLVNSARNREELVQKAGVLKTIASGIPDVFVGSKDVNAYAHPLLGYVAILSIELKAIKQANLYKFIGAVTDGQIRSESDLMRLVEAEREMYRLQREKGNRQYEEKQRVVNASLETLTRSITLPVAKAEPKTVPFVLAVPGIHSISGKAVIRLYKVFGTRGGRIVYYVEAVERQEDINPNVDTTRTGNKVWFGQSANIREKMAKGQVFRVGAEAASPERTSNPVAGASAGKPRITRNENLNRIEVRFASVPAVATRTWLKEASYYWNGKIGVWQATYSAPRWEAVQRYFGEPPAELSPVSLAKTKLKLLALKLKLELELK